MAKINIAGRTKKIIAITILFGPALALLLISSRSCSHKFLELENYGTATNYEFTDAQGVHHTSEDFKDQVVLVTTLQATCPSNCAVSFWHLDQIIYQHVRKNKKKLGSVRIISFVTDGKGNPVEDLSSVQEMLKDQVEAYDPEIWYLAKGDAKSVYDLENNGEKLVREGDEFFGGQSFQELILLLDKDNDLRMVLSGKTEGMIRRMKQYGALLQKQYDKNDAKN